jgi:hypothetical protein
MSTLKPGNMTGPSEQAVRVAAIALLLSASIFYFLFSIFSLPFRLYFSIFYFLFSTL